jgi:hypothetical protein
MCWAQPRLPLPLDMRVCVVLFPLSEVGLCPAQPNPTPTPTWVYHSCPGQHAGTGSHPVITHSRSQAQRSVMRPHPASADHMAQGCQECKQLPTFTTTNTICTWVATAIHIFHFLFCCFLRARRAVLAACAKSFWCHVWYMQLLRV